MKTFDSKRKDFAAYGLTCEEWFATSMSRADCHNEIEINFLTEGSLTYMLGGERIFVPGGTFSLFWASIPHQIVDYQPMASYMVVTIPLSWFLQWKLPDSFVQQILGGKMVTQDLIKDIDHVWWLFSRWKDDLELINNERLKTVQLEIEACLRRMAYSIVERKKSDSQALRGHGKSELKKIEIMAGFIAKNYERQLRLEDIGRAANLNPNYAAGLFKKAFGKTLNTYLTEFRVSIAQRLLVTTDMKIVEVSLDAGFNSLSRFNAAFKSICGCPPRDYRESHRQR